MIIKKLIYITLLIFCTTQNIIAQCAMCKAGAEQSLERGATDANWINYGILVMMLIPFFLIFVLYKMYKYNQNAA